MGSDRLTNTQRPRRLNNQVAVITGAGTGIGAGIATELAREGASVVINYPNERGRSSAQEVCDSIVTAGGLAGIFGADITKEEEVTALFEHAVKEYGRVDILVNNAGIQMDAAFTEMTLAQWQTVLDVNLTGQFLCSREAIRHFLRQGIYASRSCAAGKIICISSVHQTIAWAQHANYAASKGGVMMMMESIAQEFAPQKIRVNSIAPGAIRTGINKHAWATPDAEQILLRLIPYGRVGDPVDIGKAAAWLASDESDYVTGTTLFVDGGMTLYPGFSTNG
jgi:glucose 1-dehydrogenase